MLLYSGGRNEDVVDIAKHDVAILLLDVLEHHVHQTLESSDRIAESEGHACPLIQSFLGSECSLLSINFSGDDLPKGIADVN